MAGCATNLGEMRNPYEICLESSTGRNHLGNIDIGGSVMLN